MNRPTPQVQQKPYRTRPNRRKICPDGTSLPEGFSCPVRIKKPTTSPLPRRGGTKAQEFKRRYGK